MEGGIQYPEASDLEEKCVLRRNEDVNFGHINLEIPPIQWFELPTYQ